MKKFALLSAALFLSLSVFAQKEKTVEGEYTYYAPENVTLEAAKSTALERAKIQAIADVFGTAISQYNDTYVENQNGHSTIDFTSIGWSEVKGEWIETIKEPIYNIRYEGNALVVSVKIKGRAREVTSASINFKSLLLRNGTEDRFESDQFKDGDDLYLSFTSPVSGYLVVYLIDADGQANCLLPYRNQQNGTYRIEANRRYLFFSKKEASKEEYSNVDEYILNSASSSETNQIYIIFSPNKFSKAVDEDKDWNLPRQLNIDKFHKWLAKYRQHDIEMTLKRMFITIRKN